VSQTKSNKFTKIFDSEAEYDQSLYFTMEGEGTYASFSGSAGTKIGIHNNLFVKENKKYAVSTWEKRVYSFTRHATTDKNTDVMVALNAQLQSSPPVSFADFFNEWGTHYIKEGFAGGVFVVVIELDENLITQSNKTDVEANIEASFETVTASGSFDATSLIQNSTFLSKHATVKNISTYAIGGDGITNPDLDKLDAWFDSLYDKPALILNNIQNTVLDMRMLGDLLDDPAHQKAINDAILSYLTVAEEIDGIVGSPSALEFQTNYPLNHQPQQSGIVLTQVYQQFSLKNYNSYASGLVQDSAGASFPKLTTGSSCYTNLYVHSPIFNSFSLPVSNLENNSFGIRAGANNGNKYIPDNPEFYPFAPGIQIGEYSFINLSGKSGINSTQAPNNMFVIGQVEFANVGGDQHGSILGYASSNLSKLSDSASIRGAASCYWKTPFVKNQANSFCMPVAQDEYYQVEIQSGGQNTCFYYAWTCELNIPGFNLGEPFPIVPNIIHSSRGRDLLLFVVTILADKSYTGTYSVRLGGSQPTDPTHQVAIGRAHALNPWTSVLVPIAKNTTYEVTTQGTGWFHIYAMPFEELPSHST
jgi:hypothetical protein